MLVDHEAPLSKLVQLSVYGVRALVIRADYSRIMELFISARDRFGWYDCNAEYNPFRFEGNKTCAYEICDQLEWEIPDWVISPMGSCTGIAGQWRGFKELVLTDFITDTPHLAGVQADSCSPVVTALQEEAEGYRTSRAWSHDCDSHQDI